MELRYASILDKLVNSKLLLCFSDLHKYDLNLLKLKYRTYFIIITVLSRQTLLFFSSFKIVLFTVVNQVVANCLTSLQEIWGLEASTSEEAAREREALLSKPVVYYFLNRYLS